MSEFELWWNKVAKGGDPLRRPNIIREAFEAGAASPAEELKYLRREVRRLAHLVIVHGSDPAIMFGQWRANPACCAQSDRARSVPGIRRNTPSGYGFGHR